MSDTDRQLRDVLAEGGWDLPMPADPIAWVTGRAVGQRRRRAVAALAALAVVGVAVAGVRAQLPRDTREPVAGPVRTCAEEALDCVDSRSDVVPVAAMLTGLDLQELANPTGSVATNVRGYGPLSLCPGLSRPGSDVMGHLDGRYRAFGTNGPGLTQTVMRYADAAAATDALQRLVGSTAACTLSPSDGQFAGRVQRQPAPSGSRGGQWFRTTHTVGVTSAAWAVGRDVVLLTAPDEERLLPLVDRALQRVASPPDEPLCDEAGCDNGEQHPTGLPQQVTDGQNDDVVWVVIVDPDDRSALTKRGYRIETRQLQCWDGAASVVGGSPLDEAFGALVADSAGADALRDVLGRDRASSARVTLRCLA